MPMTVRELRKALSKLPDDLEIGFNVAMEPDLDSVFVVTRLAVQNVQRGSKTWSGCLLSGAPLIHKRLEKKLFEAARDWIQFYKDFADGTHRRKNTPNN